MIFKKNYKNFAENIKESFMFKEVVVSGKLGEYKGKPQIVMNNSNQIKLIIP